jgi:hypothetical protein
MQRLKAKGYKPKAKALKRYQRHRRKSKETPAFSFEL